MKQTVGAVITLLQMNNLLTKVSLGNLSEGAYLSDITFDNRTAEKDCLFICKGAAFKEAYLISAFEKGASLYIADHVVREELPHVIVSDIRLAMSKLGALFFEAQSRDVVKIGITGTKGKTTVAVLLNAILDSYCMAQCSKQTALISSLYTYDGGERIPSRLTTPEAIELWRHLAAAGDHALPLAVCEVSSQALKYKRVHDVGFDTAVFLNIGNDHISEIEHPDFEDYFASKLKIFSLASHACINSETAYFDSVYAAAKAAGCQIYTFGFSPRDTLYCSSYEHSGKVVHFSVSYCGGRAEDYSISLFGRHNVENALAAILVAKRMQIPDTFIREGLRSVHVEGRGVELTTADGNVRVIVDYAHNGMSLEALYRYVKTAYPEYRVITLFGCPGGKAMNRREDMGTVAAKHSDFIVLTEDDPAEEPLDSIFREIAFYIEKEQTPYLTEYDRGQAISLAFQQHREKTVILLCGKGAETAQKRAKGSALYEGDTYFAKQAIASYNRNLLPIG